MGRPKSNTYVTIRLQNERFGLQIEQSQPFTIVELNFFGKHTIKSCEK